uniref:Uncharacterized protein n=1 Tax=Rhizophora mucronata TaxID=61149 RepID=A0A2P2QJ84_RHIMU
MLISLKLLRFYFCLICNSWLLGHTCYSLYLC